MHRLTAFSSLSENVIGCVNQPASQSSALATSNSSSTTAGSNSSPAAVLPTSSNAISNSSASQSSSDTVSPTHTEAAPSSVIPQPSNSQGLCTTGASKCVGSDNYTQCNFGKWLAPTACPIGTTCQDISGAAVCSHKRDGPAVTTLPGQPVLTNNLDFTVEDATCFYDGVGARYHYTQNGITAVNQCSNGSICKQDGSNIKCLIVRPLPNHIAVDGSTICVKGSIAPYWTFTNYDHDPKKLGPGVWKLQQCALGTVCVNSEHPSEKGYFINPCMNEPSCESTPKCILPGSSPDSFVCVNKKLKRNSCSSGNVCNEVNEMISCTIPTSSSSISSTITSNAQSSAPSTSSSTSVASSSAPSVSSTSPLVSSSAPVTSSSATLITSILLL
ncbi:hypothetical protein K7432_017957 [Basidiobolus ranarum]|uniref:Uncharacterized protein n=1 Tax=Basidiobolus ranarum TaxID=34480 RepID=A0ABR2VJM5_9FUNG